MKTKRTRKILALFLAITMVVCLMSTTVIALTVLNSATMTVTAPVSGKTPAFTAVPGDSYKYAVTKVRWYHNDNLPSSPLTTMMDEDDTFIKNEKYIVEITLTPRAGYTFDVSATGTVNGQSTYSGGVTGQGVKMFRAMFTATSTNVELGTVSARVTAPVAGQHPNMTVIPGDSSKYSAEVLYWYAYGPSNYNDMTASDVFNPGENYRAMVRFTPKPGYDITRSTIITINSKSVMRFANDPCKGSVLFSVEKVAIPSASVTVTEPVAGTAPALSAQSADPAKYNQTNMRWYHDDNIYSSPISTIMDSDDTFVLNDAYILEMTLTPKAGYIFNDTSKITVNGIQARITGFNPDTGGAFIRVLMRVTKSDSDITTVSATIDEPVGGKTPDLNVKTDDGSPYSGRVDQWYLWEASHDPDWTEDDEFIPGEKYSVQIIVEPNEGYQFISSTVYMINGQKVRPYITQGIVVLELAFIAEDEPLSEVFLSMPEPEAGGNPPSTVVSQDDSKYTATVDCWYIMEEPYPDLSSTDVFEAEQTYAVRCWVTPKPGYLLDSSTEYIINGKTGYVVGGDSENNAELVEICFTVRGGTLISSVLATITAPAAGAKPNETVISGDSEKYTVEISPYWYKGDTFDSSVEMGYDETFESNQTYWTEIYFCPNDGYRLNYSTLAKVNGKNATVAYDYYPGMVYTISFTVPKITFADVPNDAYYKDAVNWAVENGITTGTSPTTFSPNAVCTRAHAVTFLWHACGSPAPTSTSMPFNDVPAGCYYYNAVLWAVENGIVSGTSANKFSPNTNCSRSQIVTMMWRMEGSKTVTANNPFSDVASNAYFAKAVMWAVVNNITAGTSATTFGPNDNCTRAQIVTFIYRDKI